MVALKSSKTTLKPVAVVAALSLFAALPLALADRAFAWGSGGGGGGGGGPSAKEKAADEQLQKAVKKGMKEYENDKDKQAIGPLNPNGTPRYMPGWGPFGM